MKKIIFAILTVAFSFGSTAHGGWEHNVSASTDVKIPVQLFDSSDGSEVGGKLASDTTVEYCSEDSDSWSSYDDSGHWTDIDDGTYWLEIGASEFTSSNKRYVVRVEVSGCDTYRTCVYTGAALANVTQIAGATVNPTIAQFGVNVVSASNNAIEDSDIESITVGPVTLAASQPNYAPAKAGDQMDLVSAPNATAISALQSGLATSTAQTTAQNDLDVLTGTDGAVLATSQPHYAPNTVVPDPAGTLVTYDPPTYAEMAAAFTEIKGPTFSTATDQLEDIRDRGDAAWITATGFSTHNAADVWSVASGSGPEDSYGNVLDDLTEESAGGIYCLTTAALEGSWDALLADHDTANTFGGQFMDKDDAATLAEIKAQVDQALVDIHLDHLLAVDTGASLPGVSGSIWHDLLEDDSGTWRFTANALENAPGGGSGEADWTTGEREQIRDALGITGDKATATGGQLQTIEGLVDDLETRLTAVRAGYLDALTGSGAGLTGIPWNASWDAEVQSEAADALTVYDPPTSAEMVARTLPTASYFDPATDTVIVGTNNDKTGYRLSSTGVDDIFQYAFEGTETYRTYLRCSRAIWYGLSTGGDTDTLNFRDAANTKHRVSATRDANKNRIEVTIDGL